MNILLVLLISLVFILAFIIVPYYKCKIRNLSKNPRNNVHFYVARDKNGNLWLYIGKPVRGDIEFYAGSLNKVFCLTYNIDRFGLKYEDFDSLKWEDDPVEVFLNLEA